MYALLFGLDYMLVKSSNRPRVFFYHFFKKLQAQYRFHFHFRLVNDTRKRLSKILKIVSGGLC